MCRAILVVHCPLVVRSLFAQRTARSLALRQLHLSRYAASRHATPTHNPMVARALVSASMRSANTAMRPPVQSALLWGQRSWLNGDTICHIGHVHLEMSAASGDKKKGCVHPEIELGTVACGTSIYRLHHSCTLLLSPHVSMTHKNCSRLRMTVLHAKHTHTYSGSSEGLTTLLGVSSG